MNSLPDDPLELFALNSGFEPIDLKRAYARLIRIYKPETHPAEFMKVRWAYEYLESSLRPSGPMAPVPDGGWNLSHGFKAPQSPQIKKMAGPKVIKPTTPEVNSFASMEGLLAEIAVLKGKRDMGERDYVRLALMESASRKGGRAASMLVVVEGLASLPGSQMLLDMLTAAASVWPDDADPMVLIRRYLAVSRGADFAIENTYPLWKEAFRRSPIAEVTKEMEDLCDRQGSPPAVLVLKLTRLGVFRADEAWVRRLRDSSEARLLKVNHGDDELEAIAMALAYRRERMSLLAGDQSLAKRVDSVVTGAFADPQNQAVLDEALRLAAELRDDPMMALGITQLSEEKYPLLQWIWEWTLAMAMVRSMLAPTPIDLFVFSALNVKALKPRPLILFLLEVCKAALAVSVVMVGPGVVVGLCIWGNRRGHISDDSMSFAMALGMILYVIALFGFYLWRKLKEKDGSFVQQPVLKHYMRKKRSQWSIVLFHRLVPASWISSDSAGPYFDEDKVFKQQLELLRRDWPLGLLVAARQALGMR